MRTQIKIFLTIALSLVMMSCSKDDYVPFVDSLDDLNNTFWEIHTLRCTTYTAGGELVEDFTHDTEYFYRADGPTPVDLYISNNTFHWFGWMGVGEYKYLIYPCEYNPNTHILKADYTYEVLELSRKNVILRTIGHNAKYTTVTTRHYVPKRDNDKTWEEWVEFIDSM